MRKTPFEIRHSSQFTRDLKRCLKARLPLSDLEVVMEKLVNGIPLETKHKDHQLRGNNKDFRECHIQPDWLLVYHVAGDVMTFTRTGSHSDLFG